MDFTFRLKRRGETEPWRIDAVDVESDSSVNARFISYLITPDLEAVQFIRQEAEARSSRGAIGPPSVLSHEQVASSPSAPSGEARSGAPETGAPRSSAWFWEVRLELLDPVDGVAPGERTLVFADLFRHPLAIKANAERFGRVLDAVIDWPFELVRWDRGELELLRELGYFDWPLATAILSASHAPDDAPRPA